MPSSSVKVGLARRLAVAVLLVAFAPVGPVRADTAPPLGYAGRLTDAAGAPVAGPVDLAVELYRAATGGAALNGAPFVFAGTKLQAGVFQLELPAAEVLGLLGDGSQAVFVEVTDKTHGKTYPRQRFLMVPYAARVPVDGQTLGWNASGQLTVGPETAPGANQFLTKDASGNLVWGTPSANATSIAGAAVATGTPAAGAVLKYVAGQWQAVPDTAVNRAGDTISGFLGIGTTSAQSALDVTGVLTQRGAAAPGVAPAGEGRIYYDSSTNQFMVSQNGGAYSPLGTVASGTITQVSAGAGLTGGGTTGNVTVGLAGVGTAGTYTRVLTDAYGRVTAGGTLTAADLPSIPVGLISGALPVTQLAGTLAAAQVASIPVTQLAGTLAATQISNLPVTQLSGTLTTAQLPSLSAAEVTSGTLAVALGGTGATSFPSGGVLVGAGSLPLSTVSAASQYQLLQQGASGPAFGPLELGQSAAVSGTLAVAHLPPVPAGLVTGSLAAAQISGTLAAAQVGPMPASQITGTLAAAQVGTIPVTQLSGTLAAVQVGAIPVTQLTGTFTTAQLPAIPATSITGTLGVAQISGTLAAGQVASIPVTQLSGVLTTSQLPSIPTSQLTGTLASTQIPWDSPGALGATTPNTGAFTSLTTTGQLGIATSSPLRLLHAVATSSLYGLARLETQSDLINPVLELMDNSPSHGRSPAVNFLNQFGTAKGQLGYDTANNWFRITTNGAERLRIDASGYVGIGTTTPATRFDVESSATASHFVSQLFAPGLVDGSYAAVRIGKQANTYQAMQLLYYAGTTANSYADSRFDLGFHGSGAVNLSLQTNGYVGVGTTSAGSPLSVNGVIESTAGGIKFPDGTTQASAAGSGPYKAAKIVKTTPQSIANGANVTLTSFDTTPLYDTGGFFSAGTPDRLTIPAGVTYVRAFASMQWANNATGLRYLYITKNGGAIVANTAEGEVSAQAAADGYGRGSVASAPFPVSPGDYIQAFVYQASGAALNLNYATLAVEAVNGTTVSSSGSGTANYVPLWTSATQLANSPVAVQGSNVGIGTSNPGAKLEVAGTAGTDGIKFPDGSLQKYAGILVNQVYAEDNALQTISATVGTLDTLPTNTQGVQILTATITPKSASNHLRIRSVVTGGTSGGGTPIAALFQDSGANALAAAMTSINSNAIGTLVLDYEMTAGTTSATTFAIRVGPQVGIFCRNGYYNSGCTRLWGGAVRSTLIIDEYAN